MKMIVTLACLLLTGLNATAQYKTQLFEPCAASRAYERYQFYLTTPPYGLQKVKKLIASVHPKGYGDFGPHPLSSAMYNRLSLREQFTYNMLNPEFHSQLCSAMPVVMDAQRKIGAHIPNAFGEFQWATRQEKFFLDNRDSVMFLIRESAGQSNRIGANYKQVLVDINAVALIPFVIQQYNTDRKDHDLLTVLLMLMKENKFAPFLHSPEYATLYGKDAGYQSFLYVTVQIEQRILIAARNFYKVSRKKRL